MVVIFLRQISIFRLPNKINYSSLMLGVGAISSVIHFIISPETQDLAFTLKGSLIPMLVALMLFIVMNIMHQTQMAENERTRTEFTQVLIEQIRQLKEFTLHLEQRMTQYAQEETKLRDEFMANFNKDIEALQQLLKNQSLFLERFEEAKQWHNELTELFINFTEFKLPELDSIVHKHIDMLRISEAEHYDQLKHFLKDTLGDKDTIKKELHRILDEVHKIDNVSNKIAKNITDEATKRLGMVTRSFETELAGLKSHVEALRISLSEGERSIETIKSHSEYVINQIVLLANKMESFEEKKELVDMIVDKVVVVFEKVETLENEYMAASHNLQQVSTQFRENEQKYLQELNQQLLSAINSFEKRLDTLLQEFKNATTQEELPDSVKILAKKAQLQKGGYASDDIL
jgi:hypothetical protein